MRSMTVAPSNTWVDKFRSQTRRSLVLKKAPYEAESENDLLQEGFWPVEVKF